MQQFLDFTAPRDPAYPGEFDVPESRLHGHFLTYHRMNLGVYYALRRLAMQLLDAGHRHYGVKGLFEVMRWHSALESVSTDYKLNNNYTAFYARLLMRCEPKLAGFFDVRAQAPTSDHNMGVDDDRQD